MTRLKRMKEAAIEEVKWNQACMSARWMGGMMGGMMGGVTDDG